MSVTATEVTVTTRTCRNWTHRQQGAVEVFVFGAGVSPGFYHADADNPSTLCGQLSVCLGSMPRNSKDALPLRGSAFARARHSPRRMRSTARTAGVDMDGS